MICLHATCIAIKGHGILLAGASGCGKSDLALRLLDRGAQLVSDDYTELVAHGGQLFARPPATIAGRMEVRGIGIIHRPYVADVPVALFVQLDAPVERLPDPPAFERIEGLLMTKFSLAALEPSAPIKLELMLDSVLEGKA